MKVTIELDTCCESDNQVLDRIFGDAVCKPTQIELQPTPPIQPCADAVDAVMAEDVDWTTEAKLLAKDALTVRKVPAPAVKKLIAKFEVERVSDLSATQAEQFCHELKALPVYQNA